jgi:hypothetical protein
MMGWQRRLQKYIMNVVERVFAKGAFTPSINLGIL